MDFFYICTRDAAKKGEPQEMFPDFVVGRSKDLMVRGKSFYAVWDEEAGLWSTDEYDVQRLVDEAMRKKANEAAPGTYNVKYLRSFGSNGWSQFRKFLNNVSDNSHQLDENLTFANTEVKKNDYVSRRLPYPLERGDYSAWDELVGTLYSVEERAKIEWAIGAIVAGEAKRIQKFLVLYGPAGTGKSTILNIVEKLFEGYTTTFEAKALGSANGTFATEVFKNNPLVGIQHDGDLSKIEDNTKLNSVIAHEVMTMNEKFKPGRDDRVNAFLFMGTNQPVKITDAKSGIIRRLIDVHPTGVRLTPNHYNTLMSKIDFELGAIAHHCLEVYRSMGKNYYNTYRPLEMMLQTDIFFNFIEANYDIFKSQDGTTLRQAYMLYKEYCGDTGIERPIPQYKVREELRNYFDEFKDRAEVDGHQMRSVYVGFNANKFKVPTSEANTFSLVIDETESLLDEMLANQPAQLAKDDGTPRQTWDRVRTTLFDIPTKELHYVRLPENHIVIDFDLRGDDGRKSLERNLQAASAWPATYAELSKSGEGVHLHYLYTGGDLARLSSVYSDGIEVKVYRGNASLRRALTKCNGVGVSEISSGLPLKEEKPVLHDNVIKSEVGLRKMIDRNLRKEIHPGTKPSVDFIERILKDAYESGMEYDVTDMRSTIMAFASKSTNQAMACIKAVQRMKFASEAKVVITDAPAKDERLVAFDVEVYPNLFVICWKFHGSDQVVRLVNPKSNEVEALFGLKLVGFNNRRYDNHILYAAAMGYTNAQLYALSQKIINNTPNSAFGEAYNLSYTDIWDFASKKQTLKKWEIELGLRHLEMDLPWDQPVPEELWPKVVEYCVNDVEATDALLEARAGDLQARLILAELSGLTPNHTTQQHTARIIFGKERRPQEHFVYTDLSEEFEGYVYDHGTSTYRGEVTGEGGYVHAEPGIYEDVALLDVASMHPTSLIQLNYFGDYTPRFKELLDARLYIKRGDFEAARRTMGGRLGPFLSDEGNAAALSYALKIVINIVYGLTSAKFDNPFRNIKNKDNIVAKRGALFMVDLKHFVQEQGFTVAHIKTDSIKIPNATPEIIAAVTEFGKKYGYDFEHEATYDKMALVNDAVYIARENGKWTATGAQFQHPYVFKTLFTGEEITDEDLFETKSVVKGAIYMDFEKSRPAWHTGEPLQFIGRIGRFVPVTEESGGAELWRIQEGKRFAVTGTKGYLWLESEMYKEFKQTQDIDINSDYHEKLATAAYNAIEKYGSFDEFVK